MAKPRTEDDARDQKMLQWKTIPGEQNYYAKIYREFPESRWLRQSRSSGLTTRYKWLANGW